MPKVIFMPSPNEADVVQEELPSRRTWLPWRRRRQQQEARPQVPAHLVLHPDVEDFLAPWRPTEYPPTYEQAAHRPPSPGSVLHETEHLSSVYQQPDRPTTAEASIPHGQSPAYLGDERSESKEGFLVYNERRHTPAQDLTSGAQTEPLWKTSATHATERHGTRHEVDVNSRHRARPIPPGAHNESDEPRVCTKQIRFQGDTSRDPTTPQNSPCETDSGRQRHDPEPGHMRGSNGSDGFFENVPVRSGDRDLGRLSARTQKNREGFVYPPDPRMQMWYQSRNDRYV